MASLIRALCAPAEPASVALGQSIFEWSGAGAPGINNSTNWSRSGSAGFPGILDTANSPYGGRVNGRAAAIIDILANQTLTLLALSTLGDVQLASGDLTFTTDHNDNGVIGEFDRDLSIPVDTGSDLGNSGSTTLSGSVTGV
ncbi:MAG: hypothetical protein AAGB51_06920 [Planctomycetota bacterium]